MEIIALLILWIGFAILLWNKIGPKTSKRQKTEHINPQPILQTNTPPINQYSNYYQRKLLFTKNEYYEFTKLATFAKANRLEVLAKVRLLDLIEPRNEYKKDKTFLFKIQAKHVDFVITDAKYNIVAIVELDDNSHNRPDRMQRDQFVNEILRGVGYNVIHTRSITNDILQSIYYTAYKPVSTPSEQPQRGHPEQHHP